MTINRCALFIFLALIALPAVIHAETVSCPGTVDHVLVEGGDYKPYPYLIMPDAGENNDSIWNFLSRRPKDFPITVHCFPGVSEDVKTDITIPLEIKSCTLTNKHFFCE